MQFCRVDQTVCMSTGLFWGAVDSFAGLFDGFYYIFTGESISKADKFDNLRSMKILNTPLTQKSPGIRTKRPEQEQNLQTKKGAISRPWKMNSVCVAHLIGVLAVWIQNRKKPKKKSKGGGWVSQDLREVSLLVLEKNIPPTPCDGAF